MLVVVGVGVQDFFEIPVLVGRGVSSLFEHLSCCVNATCCFGRYYNEWGSDVTRAARHVTFDDAYW